MLDDPSFLDLRPLLVNKVDDVYTIYAGNMRYRAAVDLGWTDIPVLISIDLPEEVMRKRALRDNLEYGEWDWDILANEWNHELEELDLPELNPIKTEPTPFEDDFDQEKVDGNTHGVELGDIYQLGEHRLMCGDSTSLDDVTKLLQDTKVQMVFTDPPYNLGYDFNNNGMVQTGQRKARFGAIQNDSMSDDEFDQFILDTFTNIYAVLDNGGSYYISGGRESTQVFNRVLDTIGFHIQSWLVWAKENFNISRLDYHPKHEIITYGWKDGAAHRWFGDRSQVDVLNYSRNIGKSVHPTEKPVELIAYLLKNSSQQDESVLDLFGGSGSTLVACEQMNRKNFTMEIDPHYCSVIIERWQNQTGKKAEKVADNT